MTTLREAAQQALELLKELQGGCTDSDDGTVEALTVWCPEVIENLEAALEQLEQPEQPEQAWLTGCPSCGMDGGCDCDDGTYNPPRREWQGLTEEERNACLVEADPCECLADHEAKELMLVVEAALKERNA